MIENPAPLNRREWHARAGPITHHFKIIFHAHAREIDRLNFQGAPAQRLDGWVHQDFVNFSDGILICLFFGLDLSHEKRQFRNDQGRRSTEQNFANPAGNYTFFQKPIGTGNHRFADP